MPDWNALIERGRSAGRCSLPLTMSSRRSLSTPRSCIRSHRGRTATATPTSSEQPWSSSSTRCDSIASARATKAAAASGAGAASRLRLAATTRSASFVRRPLSTASACCSLARPFTAIAVADAGARHRRQHRDLQRRALAAARAAAVPRFRAAGHAVGRHPDRSRRHHFIVSAPNWKDWREQLDVVCERRRSGKI